MKNFMITGSTGGIGSALAKEILNRYEHCKVYGWGRQAAVIDDERYEPITCDFTKPFEVESVAKAHLKQIEQLDGLILAAGYGLFAQVEQMSLQQMQAMLNVNFLSQSLITKLYLPLLKSTNESKIIAVASESALSGARKGALYCASKFALRGFMQSLRYECVQSQTAVCIINPGLVKTDFFNPLQFEPGVEACNAIKPEQVAKIIAMVLSMENNCVVEEINLQPMKKVIKKKN